MRPQNARRTYITPIPSQDLPQHPNELLVLAHSSLVRHGDRRLAFLGKRREERRPKGVDSNRMGRIERVEDVRNENPRRGLEVSSEAE